jgi:hypothetical protein
MITAMVARELGSELVTDLSASSIFRQIADEVPAYAGLRYPALKDESNPVQVSHALNAGADLETEKALLTKRLESMPSDPGKIPETPRIGHKLHRLTTMTSKTAQFHLLANGNPKPENLLVSPLEQFELDGSPKAEIAEAATVGTGDRSNPSGR